MIETEKGKRIEQILATDVTREQLAEALWCAESSQRMWHGCAEENRNFRLKAEAENAKLRELVAEMHPRAKAFLQMAVQLGCNDSMSYDWELQMRDLGIEVD